MFQLLGSADVGVEAVSSISGNKQANKQKSSENHAVGITHIQNQVERNEVLSGL